MKTLSLKGLDISKALLSEEDLKQGTNKIFLALLRGAIADKKAMSMDQHRLWGKVQDRWEDAKEDDDITLDNDQFSFAMEIVHGYTPPTAHPGVGRLAVELEDYLEKVKIEQKDK